MKSIIALLVLGFSLSAHAAPSKFSCSNVGGNDEWIIYVDLSKKLAGFFDNDSTVSASLVSVLSLESHPPQTEYGFEGTDTHGEKIRIIFNITRMTAYVIFVDAKNEPKSLRAEDRCRADDSVSL